jgi:hypothetical protein
MSATSPAPRGFRWAERPTGRAILVVLIVISLGLSIYASARYVTLVNCLQEHATADAVRTAAIARATDVERETDRALLIGVVPGGPAGAELRRQALAARAATDAVRAANPPPAGSEASCS